MTLIISQAVKEVFPIALILIVIYKLLLKYKLACSLLTEKVRDRDNHDTPTPKLGGIGIFIALILYELVFVLI